MTPQIQQLIGQAIECFQSGSPKQAEEILTRVLNTQSNNLPALEILGLIKASQGNHLEAAKLLKKAIKLNPQNPATQYNLAKALSESKDYIGSLIHHEKALQLAPNNPDGWLNYGQTLANLKRHEQALTAFNKALSINPQYAEAWHNKALACAQLERHEEAIASLNKAIELQPNHAKAWLDMSSSLGALKRYQEALQCCERALAIQPNYPEAWLNKGSAYIELKQFSQALDCCNKALDLNPRYEKAWLNASTSLGALKRYQEALQCCEQALALQPNYPEAWLNKGSAYNELRQFSQALDCFNQALGLKTDLVDARYNKGGALDNLGRQKEALDCYNEVIELDPNYTNAWLNKGSIYAGRNDDEDALYCYQKTINLNSETKYIHAITIFIKGKIGNWDNYEDDVSNLLEKLNIQPKIALPFSLLALSDNPQNQTKAAQDFTNIEYPPQDSLGPILKHNHPKIKVAYFSADFKDHAVSYLTAELFELHDRNQFEVYAFSLKRNQSAIRERLVAGFDHFIEVDDKTDIEIATLVRNLEIDIAVDLGGHTQDARTGIFSYRAAPIQVNFLGFAGTMGASYMDYIVADKVVIPPEHQQYYLEKKVYLPNSYMVDDSKRVPSNKQFSRSEFGLPENGAIFCCFNNSYKFNPPRVASFAKILTKTPNSVLWVSENNASFKKNLLAEFAKLGVPENRIVFAGRVNALEDHLARYRLADLFLDTSPYNAHTTALDSLKAGVPIITLAGKAFASRVGASLLTAIGLPELITNSEEEFVELASQLGQDAQKLKLLKDKLAANYLTMPLFNSKLFCKHLEAAYQEMHRHYINDLPPSDIYIK